MYSFKLNFEIGHLTGPGKVSVNTCQLGEGRDTAQHTLELCPTWELSRYTLRHVIGKRLTPSAIIEAMLNGPQEYEAVRLFCERVMLAKKRAERERKKNSHPCRITRWREMALRRPRAASSPSQRTTTRRGDSARGNAPPPLTPNSTVRELLGLAGTRGRGKGVQQKIIHKRFLEHSCHTRRMVIVEFQQVRVRHYSAVTHYQQQRSVHEDFSTCKKRLPVS